MTSCCPSGYTYNIYTGKCVTVVNSTVVDPVDCPCCPPGSVYVDQDGYYIEGNPLSPSYGQRVQILNPAPYTGLTNVCVNIFNTGWAVPTGQDDIDCPCCQPGDWYNNIDGFCVDGFHVQYDPIPCIPCVCPDPTEPPPPCETCGESGGQPINFTYNPFIKQCVDCQPQNFELPDDCKMNAFMPYFIIIPNTNNFTTE